MSTLIGDGAHARDIRATRTFTRYIADHRLYEPDDSYVIGVNDPWLRARIQFELGGPEVSWVHPDARLYVGVNVLPGTHINYGVTMTRTAIGRHCTISPGVTICGDVTIGDRVLVGAGATVCDRVLIGNDVTIGAGAVVLPESVVSDGTWVGVPARPIHV